MDYEQILKDLSTSIRFWVDEQYVTISHDTETGKTIIELSEDYDYFITVFINKLFRFQCLNNKLEISRYENQTFDDYKLILESGDSRLTLDYKEITHIETGALGVYP